MDLVLRRPAKYSIFRNEEEIKLFILVTFAEIHATVKKKGGKLFFADETHVQQDSGNLRGFTIVGKAPKLIHNPKTSGHRVCSLLIVISREGDMTYTLETEKISAVEFIDLLGNVLKDNRNTMIHIILDNARIHHAKLVKEFLKKHKRMNLYYLPPYAPEINPVEYLNQTIKVDIRNQKSMDKEELIDYCYDLMNRFKNDKATIKLCFEAKYVAYTILP